MAPVAIPFQQAPGKRIVEAPCAPMTVNVAPPREDAEAAPLPGPEVITTQPSADTEAPPQEDTDSTTTSNVEPAGTPARSLFKVVTRKQAASSTAETNNVASSSYAMSPSPPFSLVPQPSQSAFAEHSIDDSRFNLDANEHEELKRFLDSFILSEHKDGPKEDEIARQLSRQISEEKEKEIKIIASRLGRTFLNNTSSEEDSGEGITAVKIKGGETVSETDIKFGSLVEPMDPVPTALADLVSVAPKETFKVETAAEGTTNEEEFLDLQKQPKSKIRIFSDRQQFEHYIKSHIDPDAFSWRIIEGVAEFVVLSLHVLFGTNRIIEIQNEGGDVENLKHLDVCHQLYQNFLGECKCGVDLSYNGEKVGETKRALYKRGTRGLFSGCNG
ncbi:uncharacterized protein LOC128546429 [Mercenaria mercenaria]|uniref:uncharacterized protein LOC128546429 n=1 Tax=Mercenaria mercenaria TaxID=6596 RepID=UPI00234E90EF|nr:uncharacterized protein LOC128546429 [Mercenaria mercenaria]